MLHHLAYRLYTLRNQFLRSHHRRTCFYALCLISKTPQGATVLLEANWTTVRHTLEEKWPLAIDPNLDFSEESVFTPMVELPLPPYGNAPCRVVSYKDFSGVKTTTLPGKVAALGKEAVDEGSGTKFTVAENSTRARGSAIEHGVLQKSASTSTDLILGEPPRQKGTMKRLSRRQLVSGSVIRSEKRSRNKSRLVNGQMVKGRPCSLNVEVLLDSPDEKRM